jgi:hypothetical protein
MISFLTTQSKSLTFCTKVEHHVLGHPYFGGYIWIVVLFAALVKDVLIHGFQIKNGTVVPLAAGSIIGCVTDIRWNDAGFMVVLPQGSIVVRFLHFVRCVL